MSFLYPSGMTILLSHTTALEALRHLGELPKQGSPADATCNFAVEPSDGPVAITLWREALHCEPSLPLNVLVTPEVPRMRSQVIKTHHSAALPSAGSIIKLAPGLGCTSPAQLCLQMAPGLTKLELLMLMMELMGTYAIRPDVARGMVSRAKPLLRIDDFKAYIERNPQVSGTAKTRWCLEHVIEGAASPRESKLSLRLSLKPALGGYGLSVTSLNEEVTVARLASGTACIRKPDVLLANPQLGNTGPFVALEYDGGDHLDGKRHAEDLRRTNELKAAGISEYVIDKRLYESLPYMDALVDHIRSDLGMAPPHLTKRQLAHRRTLRRELFEELELIDGVSWNGKARERARRGDTQEGKVAHEEVPIEAYGL